MSAINLSYSEAKKISITDYLSGLGFEPAKIRGIDYWYNSPFREERTPSFKVNTNRNVWYDHGTGEGGTILDLGAKLHQCTLQEFLERLSSGNASGVSLHQQKNQPAKPESRLKVISANDLTSADLIYYLNSRGIDAATAKEYCKEIEFRIGLGKYNAIGFPNQSGAYELRNSWFKGSSSPKDISLVKNGSSQISVLEGFMDFLSVLKIDNGEIIQMTRESDFLILNSLRMLNRSLPILQSYKEINLFLDNDLAAKEAKEILNQKGISYLDASPIYGKHKDVNEYLKSMSNIVQGHKLTRKRSRGIGR